MNWFDECFVDLRTGVDYNLLMWTRSRDTRQTVSSDDYTSLLSFKNVYEAALFYAYADDEPGPVPSEHRLVVSDEDEFDSDSDVDDWWGDAKRIRMENMAEDDEGPTRPAADVSALVDMGWNFDAGDGLAEYDPLYV